MRLEPYTFMYKYNSLTWSFTQKLYQFMALMKLKDPQFTIIHDCMPSPCYWAKNVKSYLIFTYYGRLHQFDLDESKHKIKMTNTGIPASCNETNVKLYIMTNDY